VSSWMVRRISGFERASCLVLRRDAECSTFGMARYLCHDIFTHVKHLGNKMKSETGVERSALRGGDN